MALKTPLYDWHVAHNGKMVDFAGWDMPLHYGSQLNEHHAVRQHAGLFDVSHMAVIDLHGQSVVAFLRYILANDVAKLTVPGRALYTCMLNEKAGVIDDLIVYYLNSEFYRLVVNAGTRQKDLAWLNQHALAFNVNVIERTDLAMLAVQGPQSLALVQEIIGATPDLTVQASFSAVEYQSWFIAKTGYTGELGVEIILPQTESVALAQRLIDLGVAPCGLGARDTLRLEAGLNLYGTDMDETIHPLAANLGWTIAWQPSDRDFIGRKVLQSIKEQGSETKLVGLKLLAPGVMRNHQKIIVPGIGEGEITSGGFSPTLNASIALARVPCATGDTCQVEIRGKLLPAAVIKPPFVKQGKFLI